MADYITGAILNEGINNIMNNYSVEDIKKVANSAKQSALKTGEKGINILKTNPKYFGLAMAVELLIIWLILYKWSPFGVSEKVPGLVTGVMLLNGFINLALFTLVSLNWNSDTEQVRNVNITMWHMVSKVGLTAIAVLGIVFIIWSTLMLIEHPLILSWVLWFFNFLYVSISGLVIMAVAYLIFKPYIEAGKKQGAASVFSLIGSFIMYTPCALIDLVEWFKHQYSITTSTTWILLGIEALVICLGFILPKVITWALTRNGKHLLREPIYLNKQTVIGTHKDFYGNQKDNSGTYEIGKVVKITNESPEKTPPKHKYKYSISGWFWLNPQPPNTRASYTKYTNILEYGDKPVVEYNGLENSLRVRCQIVDDKYVTIFETDEIDFQTWNNIVINYDGANMDVFLNGELVGSRPGIAPYMTYENLVVGEDKGLEGGIANVIYYDKILQKSQISMAYKSLKNLPSPVL